MIKKITACITMILCIYFVYRMPSEYTVTYEPFYPETEKNERVDGWTEITDPYETREIYDFLNFFVQGVKMEYSEYTKDSAAYFIAQKMVQTDDPDVHYEENRKCKVEWRILKENMIKYFDLVQTPDEIFNRAVYVNEAEGTAYFYAVDPEKMNSEKELVIEHIFKSPYIYRVEGTIQGTDEKVFACIMESEDDGRFLLCQFGYGR